MSLLFLHLGQFDLIFNPLIKNLLLFVLRRRLRRPLLWFLCKLPDTMLPGFLFSQGKGRQYWWSGKAHGCPPQGMSWTEGGACGGHGVPGDPGRTLLHRWMTNDTLHHRGVSGMVCADSTRLELLPNVSGAWDSYRSMGPGGPKVTDLRPGGLLCGPGTRSWGQAGESRGSDWEATHAPGENQGAKRNLMVPSLASNFSHVPCRVTPTQQTKAIPGEPEGMTRKRGGSTKPFSVPGSEEAPRCRNRWKDGLGAGIGKESVPNELN